MRRRRQVLGCVLAGGCLSLGLVMCRDATQMVIVVSTDLPCNDHGGTSVVVGKLAALEGRAPTTFSSTCTADGKIGTLVVVPSGGDSDEIAFEVSTGIGVDPETCSGATPGPTCIVARRSLRFLPQETVRLRVPMKRVCAGVDCDPNSTCYNGACVSALIDPTRCTGEGCGEEALGSAPPADGGDSGSDAGIDAPDAIADGPAFEGSIAPNAEVVIGQDHACALVDGSVFCWGANRYGQLGVGQDAAAAPDLFKPTRVVGLTDVKLIATVSDTTAAIQSDGKVFVWGENFHSQIPNTSGNPDAPQVQALLFGLAQICLGTGHGCGLDATGSMLKCWGGVYTRSGMADISPPKDLNLGAEAASITCGETLTVLRMKDGTIRTFGAASDALGHGGDAGTAPVMVPGVTGVVASATGWYDTLASLGDGGRVGWGPNSYGIVGPVGAMGVPPSSLPEYADYSPIVVGLSYACGMKASQVYCWGDNSWGQLGQNNTVGVRNSTPTVINLPGPVARVFGGGSHACARLVAGQLYCWGANDHGQLGYGFKNDAGPEHPDPVEVVFPP